MPNTYTPTAVAMTAITEPIDGETRNAASVTTMTRALANGVAFLTSLGPLKFDRLTNASGTWTTPPNVTVALVLTIGGGGGGGKGALGRAAITQWACGGGGGAGGGMSIAPVSVTPGAAHTYLCGASGAGATTAAAKAADGSPSSFIATTSVVARGGCGGQSAAAVVNYFGTAQTLIQTLGGAGTSGANGTADDQMLGFGLGNPGVEIRNELSATDGTGSVGPKSISIPRTHGAGGWGATSNAATVATSGRIAGSGVTGLAGGTAGFGAGPGIDSGSYAAGGGGGGGGGGSGSGAAGGVGGSANGAGAGVAGTVGANASANTGGGGGGGGAGGAGSGSGGAGASGGNGGSGVIWVIYSGAQAVFT